MAQNPYLLDGFTDGFSQGLDIVWKMQDRKIAEEDRAYSRQKDVEDREAEKEERGLRKQKLEQDYQISAAQEERAAKDAPVERRYRTALAESAEESTRASKKARQALSAEARLNQLEEFVPTLKELIHDDEWLAFGEEAEALTGGMVSPNFDSKQFAERGLNWINKWQKNSLQEGIGTTIQDSTAAQQKVPNGAKIVSKRVKNFYFSEDKDNPGEIALELEVTVEKDGKTYTYDAPVTKNRTDKPDDEVLFVPLSSLKQAFGAAASLKKAKEDLQMQGKTTQDLLAEIDANLASLRTKTKQPAKSSKEKETERLAQELGIPYAEAWKIMSDEKLKNQLGSTAANIRNNHPDWSEQQVAQAAYQSLGLSAPGAQKPASGMSVPSGGTGWTVEVVEPEQVVGE